jgi:hypothetical protein
VKTKLKSKPCIEYGGKNILSNFWLKVGLSREELSALRQITKTLQPRRWQTTGNAASLVLTTALMHWEILWPLVIADLKYAKAEGFIHQEYFQAETIARKFNLPHSAQVL